MKNDVYTKLAAHLDNLPGGYPSTENGVELRILRRLFTPEEAEMTLHLSVLPEQSKVIARRAKLSVEETTTRLEEMYQKGLILKIKREGRPVLYMALQFAIGIWEYHVNDLDPELAKDVGEYIPTVLNTDTWKKAPQLRTIPVNKSIDHKLEILPYENVEELVKAQDKFLVAPCICRKEKKLLDEGCEKPEENCLIFGLGADLYHDRGIGRYIDKEEALKILKEADDAGLVLQPSNSKDIVNICCCCGCCCGVLRTIKQHPKPATIVSTPFICAAKPETCIGCGVCVQRCQMDALSLEEDRIVLDLDRCIGCGVCVTTCLTESLCLVRKPESEQKDVPKTFRDTMIHLLKVRGKLKPSRVASTVLKSKIDRIMTIK
ncbi:MAG: 4Fe-4S dicluster domain-containing protein [Candidatus Aminicenantes bacterium]|nr:4Fe-4S dicluster domain-containing protein [Candidatus Aminicenantes bacterium]